MPVSAVDYAYAEKSYNTFVMHKTVTPLGCWIPNKKPRSDGYVRYSITSGSLERAFGFGHPYKGEQTFYVHHLSVYIRDKCVPDGRQQQVSHLCHNRACFNPEHLCVESAVYNNARKNCAYAIVCPHPCCVGKEPLIICQHSPRCLASGK